MERERETQGRTSFMFTLQLPCSSHEVVDTEINGQMPVGLWSGQEGRGENNSSIAKPRKGKSVSKMSAEESSIFFKLVSLRFCPIAPHLFSLTFNQIFKSPPWIMEEASMSALKGRKSLRTPKITKCHDEIFIGHFAQCQKSASLELSYKSTCTLAECEYWVHSAIWEPSAHSLHFLKWGIPRLFFFIFIFSY